MPSNMAANTNHVTLLKNRYAMRTCVCYLESIVGYVVLSYTVQILASLVSYGVMFVSQL